MTQVDRIVGKYHGENNGPLLVCIGGIHGNEPAGLKAIDLMLKMLEVEPITNPDFVFNGSFLGLIGNVKAKKQNLRFVSQDLNRMFKKEIVDEVLKADRNDLENEYLELRDLIDVIHEHIRLFKPSKMVVLDLHTTSSRGGIFGICNDDPESIALAVELHAPVIKGLLSSIKGTTLHYFDSHNFPIPTVPITFESGQHQEPLSVNRAIAAITNCMRSIGLVKATHVENRHDKILIEYSKELPKVVELIGHHGIKPKDQFKMKPNYKNFQKIKKGELLAVDINGEVRATVDGRILMPLYQDQGEDGFFIVKIVEGY